MDFKKQQLIHKQLLLSSTLRFTTGMFSYINKAPYHVGEHHVKICEYLDRVIKGDIRKLIINIGPRYGKCVDADTRISTERGWVPAGEVKAGDMLYSFNEGKLCVRKCNAVGTAHKESVKIKMRSGREFICSSDHPMLTTFGYKEAGQLVPGERIRSLKQNTKNDYPSNILSVEGISGYKSVDIDGASFMKISEKYPRLKKYINEDFYLDKVVSIEELGMRDLIDIEVDDTHNFIGNGLVSHNTLLVSQMFIAYGLALNPKSKFLHLSYSGSLTLDNSMAVKDIITSEYFQNVFTDCRIEKGNNTRAKWGTTEGGGEYATSTLGQITGFGAGQVELDEEEQNIDEFTTFYNPDRFSGAIVIDDPLRPDDALSDTVRESVNRRFETTIRNRVNSRRTPIIIIMQRLHEHDLCGYLQEIEPNDWTVLSLPAITIDENGAEKALWPFKHSLKELYKIKHASEFVFETQYMQNPTPMEGLMYRQFKTYDILPNRRTAKMHGNYTDSADTGSDFLCSICFDAHQEGYYVTDVLYTKKPMEYTEQAQAQMVTRNQTDICWVESNNGGRTYMRNVERITRTYGNKKTRFVSFTQHKNKQIRIFTRSNEVSNMLIFPSNWQQRWPEFYHDLVFYRKEGINAHDDAPDACTGIIEKCEEHLNSASDEQLLRDLL